MKSDVLSLSIRLVALFLYEFIIIITFDNHRICINFLYLNNLYG